MSNLLSESVSSTPVLSGELRAWVAQFVPVDAGELVTDHPWAVTYRIRSVGGNLFVKVLPPSQRRAIMALPVLSRLFPQCVPEVIAVDSDRGFLLQRDHGGTDVGSDSDEEIRRSVLRTYATLQAAAVHHAELLALLPDLDERTMVTEFLEYLRPWERPLETVGADHFLGGQQAAWYHSRFARRASLLEALIRRAGQLPRTINHGDLRLRNVAVTGEEELVIFDWDEAVCGPAGMSLHNFFSGCSLAAALLYDDAAAVPAGVPRRYAQRLHDYVETLVEQGYADRSLLRESLTGSMCAGVMRYLISYGKFPLPDERDRQQVAEILRRRLDDLLSLCDRLAVRNRETVLRCAEDYQTGKALDRAQALLHQYLRNSPEDAELRARLVQVLSESNDDEVAEACCRRGLEREPTHAGLRCLLGQLLADQLQLESAVDQLRLAAHAAPGDETIQQLLLETQELFEAGRNAHRSGSVPTIRFSPHDVVRQRIPKAKLRLANQLFRDFGVLLVENVFCPAMLERLAQRFLNRYQPYLAGDRPGGALRVGNKRFMITVDVEGAFNSPSLYAAPLLMPILTRSLGDRFVMGSFTAVTSLPGAADMRMHKDHPALFPDEERRMQLPTFAVTTLVPLLGFDPEMGTTRVVKGSHRQSSDVSAEMEFQDPLGPQGSCLLMDYRLSHQGLANRSSRVRPVLSLVYNRPWFRDSVNYEQQDPLRISATELARVPRDWRRLFGWLPQVECV